MTVKELREQIETYREGLKKAEGHLLISSANGPAMGILIAMVQTLERQEARLEALERMAAGGK